VKKSRHAINLSAKTEIIKSNLFGKTQSIQQLKNSEKSKISKTSIAICLNMRQQGQSDWACVRAMGQPVRRPAKHFHPQAPKRSSAPKISTIFLAYAQRKH
jgi:hypothetical protein